jgi:hypothetical protein
VILFTEKYCLTGELIFMRYLIVILRDKNLIIDKFHVDIGVSLIKGECVSIRTLLVGKLPSSKLVNFD